jgi:hypothetical protein
MAVTAKWEARVLQRLVRWWVVLVQTAASVVLVDLQLVVAWSDLRTHSLLLRLRLRQEMSP